MLFAIVTDQTGPTKMPFLRRRVQDALGIVVEDVGGVDPMTAVAAGAAIYCEGRDWSAAGSTAKISHRSESSGERVTVAYDYQARTSSVTARLEVKQRTGSIKTSSAPFGSTGSGAIATSPRTYLSSIGSSPSGIRARATADAPAVRRALVGVLVDPVGGEFSGAERASLMRR